jgi:integrase/recombinase XerD
MKASGRRDEKLTVYSAIEGFLSRDLNPNTRRAFATDLKRFAVDYGNWQINELTKKELKAYLDGLVKRSGEPVAISTYNRHFGTLQNLFGWTASLGREAESDEFLSGIVRSPLSGLRRKKAPAALPRPLAPSDAATILSRAEPYRDKALFTLLYDSGVRIQEALNIDVEDLDLREGTVRIWGKGSRERVGFLSKRSAKLIERYLRDRGRVSTGALFVSRQYTEATGDRLSYAMAYRLFRKYSEGISYRGSPASMHQLRHSFGSERAGVIDALALRQLMGHRSLRTTLRYAEVNPAAAHEAFRRYEADRQRE